MDGVVAGSKGEHPDKLALRLHAMRRLEQRHQLESLEVIHFAEGSFLYVLL
jgi:hypothetical protein